MADVTDLNFQDGGNALNIGYISNPLASGGGTAAVNIDFQEHGVMYDTTSGSPAVTTRRFVPYSNIGEISQQL